MLTVKQQEMKNNFQEICQYEIGKIEVEIEETSKNNKNLNLVNIQLGNIMEKLRIFCYYELIWFWFLANDGKLENEKDLNLQLETSSKDIMFVQNQRKRSGTSTPELPPLVINELEIQKVIDSNAYILVPGKLNYKLQIPILPFNLQFSYFNFVIL
jgi:hypothetical protein